MEVSRCSFYILTGNAIGKRPLRRSRPRQEDSARMDLNEVSENTSKWVDSVQDWDY